jgi:glyoxylase-like metal-dependent hydrolase (beta-lactamase superfamily II)
VLFDIEQAAPDTWLALARPASPLNANIPIYLDATGFVIVDACSTVAHARALRQQIRDQIHATAPIRYLALTHGHYDHADGLEGLRDPGTIVVAHERVSPKADITFRDRLTLKLAQRELQLAVFGRGHTAADVCVWCAATKTVATGDLVVGFVPGMGDGFPLEWPQTLDRLAGLPFETVLPGHGPVQRGRRRFQHFREHLIATIDAARRGGSAEDVLSKAEGDFGSFLAANAARFRPLTQGVRGRDSVLSGIRANLNIMKPK